MGVGQILLQPQKLQRARTRAPEAAILDDLVALAVLLASDAAQGGPLPGLLAKAAEHAVLKLAQQAASGAISASGRLKALCQPVLSALETLTQSPVDNASAAADLFVQNLAQAIAAIRALTNARLRATFQAILDILEQDLGLGPDAIALAIWDWFDGMATEVAQAPDSETADQRIRRLEAVSILRRMKRDAQPGFQVPRLDADRAAQALISILKTPSVDSAIGRAACVSKATATGFHLGRSILDLAAPPAPPAPAPFALSFDTPAPVDNRPPVQVSYYATKLLNTQNWDGDWGELPAAVEASLKDGLVSKDVREAFRPLSILLSTFSFLVTTDDKKDKQKWTVTDRKQYIVQKQSGGFNVFPRIEFKTTDFNSANTGDLSKLKDLFKKSGIIFQTPAVTAGSDGSSWDIRDAGSGPVFHLVSANNTITVFPPNPSDYSLSLAADLESDLTQKQVSAALVKAFQDNGIVLSARTRISPRDGAGAWNIDDGDFDFHIKKDSGKLLVDTGGFIGWVCSTLSFPPVTEKIWLNRDRTQVMLGHRILYAGDAVKWQDAPKFKQLQGNSYYTFSNVTPETAEKFAYVASWVQDMLHTAVYLATIGIAAEAGTAQYAATSNSLNAAKSLSDMIAKLAKDRSVADLVGIDSQTWLFDWGWWYDFLTYAGIKAVGAVESIAKPSAPDFPGANTFSKFVDSVLGALLGTKWVDNYWVDLLYEALLSSLTLSNHIEPTDPKIQRPENYKEKGGFVDPFWNVALLVYCATVPDSEYALPFQTLNLTLYRWLLGVLAVSVPVGFLGWILAHMGVARSGFTSDPKDLAKTLAKSWGKSTAYFFPFLKLVKNKS